MTQPPPQLDYAPQAPWHRRRVARQVLALFAALLIALSLWRFGPEALRHAGLLSLQKEAMNFSAPRDMIAFTTDDKLAKHCLSLTGRYTSTNPQNAALVIEPWRDFYAAYSPPGGQPGAAFCHELITPSGYSRLVVVLVADRSMDALPIVTLQPVIFVPGTLFTRPKQVLTSGDGTGLHELGTTLCVGQVDPADASHFTIDIERNGTRDVIDGYLTDKDTVTLEPRNAASRVPSPWTPRSRGGR